MPPLPPKKKGEAGAAGGEKKKKELPKELCGCGADTYRPPPKGKKLMAPVEHQPGCIYQRTTCDAYPNLPRCEVCQSPCKYCLGKYRWCPHCYERQCLYRYKRVVHGWEPAGVDAGPATGLSLAARHHDQRSTTVTFLATDAAKRRAGSRSSSRVRV